MLSGQASDTLGPDKFQTIQNATPSTANKNGPFGGTSQAFNRSGLHMLDSIDLNMHTRTATNLIDANISSVKNYKLHVLKQQ